MSMKQGRRVAAQWMLACGAWLVAAAPVQAQDYPTRPVRLIVPFAAGGSADVFGRFIAQRLQESMGQSFVVDNRPGAGSVIGTDAVAKSAPDGYTLAGDVEHPHRERSAAAQQAVSADARLRRRGTDQCVRPGAGGHAPVWRPAPCPTCCARPRPRPTG
jgi:tripartite-type tricarboxylate transporter receptor subunit TctC